MVDYQTVAKIVVLGIDALGVMLGLWVYLHQPKSKLTKIFLLLVPFMIIWLAGACLARLIPERHDLSLMVLKFAWAITGPFFVTLYFFVVYFLKEEKRYSILSWCASISAIFCFVVIFFTDKVIRGISFLPQEIPIFGLEFVFGDWIFPFLGYILAVSALMLYLIWKNYFTLPPEEKIRAKYFLIGLIIFLMSNVIFNIYYPVFVGTSKYYQLGDYSLIFLLGFTAYAIVKHHLFGVRVILTEILVGIIILLLLFNIAVSKTLFEYVWKGFLFFSFLVVAYLLIKSVLKEINQRQRIEKMAQELRAVNQSLEGLTENLEEKVKERTRQLQGRIEELEKFHKLTIGRELRMAELKKEIRKLKTELEEER